MQKIFILLLLPLFLNAQNSKDSFTPEEVRADMAFLKKRFEKIHPGMYYYMSKEEYNKKYDSLYNTINQPLSYLETFRVLSRLVTNVKDGHTNLRYDKKRFNKKNAKFVPFYLRKIDKNYYLALNYSADSTIIRGAEVLAFNNEPVEQLIQKLKVFVSSDNGSEHVKDYYTVSAFPTYYKRYFGEVDSIKISYRLPKNDSIFNKKVACQTNSEILKIDKKRYKNLNRPNLSLKIMDSVNHIAKLDITSFSMSGKFLDVSEQKFKRVLRARFKTIKQLKVEHLIVDFRANGGGFIPNVSRLLKYLSPKPFTLVDTVAFKKKAYFVIFKPYYFGPPVTMWLGFMKRNGEFMYRVNKRNDRHKPEKTLAYRGKTYFITDPGCYSATTFTLNLAKDLGIPEKIIGQQVGGATWGSFAVNWQDFKLPNTKFIVHTPLMKINHNLPNKVNKDFFVQPDYEVNRNREELLKNNTSVIDFTVDMIRQSKAMRER
ncbi:MULTISPECIES: S41 family peptidase [Emticicia]|uniref:S41 family peptidase n=1 Tax=Emticicia TaxID=312278 RepID=UPI0007D8B835|nr:MULTISPECIES: S41 family peptidase [Emticicia]